MKFFSIETILVMSSSLLVPKMGNDLQLKRSDFNVPNKKIWNEASKSSRDKVTDKSGRLSNTFANFNEFILLLCTKWF